MSVSTSARAPENHPGALQVVLLRDCVTNALWWREVDPSDGNKMFLKWAFHRTGDLAGKGGRAGVFFAGLWPLFSSERPYVLQVWMCFSNLKPFSQDRKTKTLEEKEKQVRQTHREQQKDSQRSGKDTHYLKCIGYHTNSFPSCISRCLLSKW